MFASLRKRFHGRDFLSIGDVTGEEIRAMIDIARELKEARYRGDRHTLCEGKTLAMIFQKPSTRTRVSFEVAMYQLGGYALYLNAQDLQLGRGETIADTARVLSRYVDGIMIRTFSQEDVVALAEAATIPVINGLTDWEHPCQILADLMTILEAKGRFEGLKVAWVGDGNNVCHSLLLAAPRVRMDIAVATPPGYEPHPEIVAAAKEAAAGSKVEVLNDPVEAVREADVVVTDVWASMGQEAEHTERVRIFRPYQVNASLLRHARPDCIFLHCLPAHRGEEVADEVIDGPASRVWDEAENRLHVQKALLALVL
ncbi:ornithine carbamoyltransferase [Thermodesulfitimonas autotrophica]|uniref:Ornithine carbamoyltransferase n=1 Tax=Thermodesulfitimonas autotrophica TaxID=1894989 RepID=A0A3N5AE70_9THEO|nr:ornithine carbamoyltransferase [Thermodesulfitimonas autotrophica]RPF42863.1 ornithine carbamoyltransferase [Thermodesulfitimonas autotrophica]